MDRAGKLIASLRLPSDVLSCEALVRAAWPQAVGKRIAARTRPVALRESSLIVDVDDAVWQAQLTTLAGQILGKLTHILGRHAVSRIEFRVRIPRIGPQRAGEERPASPDEADSISDPVLRRLYEAARKRSQA